MPWRSGYVLVGLAMIAPYLNRHGWFWGAGYQGSKDPHLFECGSALIVSAVPAPPIAGAVIARV